MGCPIVCFLLLSPFAIAGTSDQRPFWTEQSSFLQGQDFYAVGVASHEPSIEDGRRHAFANGVTEFKNFAQVGSLDGIVISTKMTYEEVNEDGTVTVFRLLHVPVEKLVARQHDYHAPTFLEYGGQRIHSRKFDQADEQERAIAHLSRTIESGAQQRSMMSCRYIEEGMTPTQVKGMLGPSDSDTLHEGFGTLNYGTTEVWFIRGQVEYLELGQPCH